MCVRGVFVCVCVCAFVAGRYKTFSTTRMLNSIHTLTVTLLALMDLVMLVYHAILMVTPLCS